MIPATRGAPRRARRAAAGASAAALLVPAAATGAAARVPADTGSRVAFRISDPRITESSGLATSLRHPGVVYTHNDSGGVPAVYALGPDGRTRATLTLGGATARDWEAMAVGRDERGRPCVFVADIGDNLGGAWPYVTVYRIPEPASLRTQTIRAAKFKIKYEDGPRNAEAMLIDPRTNRLYIASKLFNASLYAAPPKLSTHGYNIMRKVGDAPAIATDGAFAPNGLSFVIRTYFGARVYAMGKDGKPGRSLGSVGLPAQKQGESVTYTRDGSALLVGSEGADQPVYEVPLDADLRPSPAASATPRPAAEDGRADEGRKSSSGPRVGLFLVLGIAALVGYGVVRRKS
ncbi:hypothetical protein [Actinomadura atramentaria]|uniref:hypothetical protein n=1 Tax=Actinomadura atramentaria TaxID=1990 RepID=UPI00035D2939|nr:hypothetical protein [Actinomadura atramentaria]